MTRSKYSLIIYTVAIFFIGISVYYYFAFKTASDIPVHVEFTKYMFKTRQIVPNFLYYFSIYLVSFFSANTNALLWASIAVLSFMLCLKFIITSKILISYLGSEYVSKNISINKQIIPVTSFAFLIMFTHNLPVWPLLRMYLGQFPPNVWHNSTTIFLMPFSLLLFWTSYLYLRDGNKKHIKWISVFVLINLLIKPSFLFVFVIVFPVLLFLRMKLTKNFFLGLAVIIAAIFLISVQYFLIYQQKNIYPDMLGIAIDPFHSWKQFSFNPLISLTASIFFPLCFMFFYFDKVRINILFQYTICLFVSSLAIFILFKENGIRETHLNFIWQVIISNYLLFVSSLCLFLKFLKNKNTLSKEDRIILMSFLLHVVMGPVYFVKILLTGTYG